MRYCMNAKKPILVTVVAVVTVLALLACGFALLVRKGGYSGKMKIRSYQDIFTVETEELGKKDYSFSLFNERRWVFKLPCDCAPSYYITVGGETLTYVEGTGELRRGVFCVTLNEEERETFSLYLKELFEKQREKYVDRSTSVMYAWEGELTEDALSEAIKRYEREYTPFNASELYRKKLAMFYSEHKGYRCEVVRVSPVDKNAPNVELTEFNTGDGVSVSVGELYNRVNVSLWYYDDTMNGYDTWSYLVRISGDNQRQYYYYFRVNYAQ